MSTAMKELKTLLTPAYDVADHDITQKWDRKLNIRFTVTESLVVLVLNIVSFP
jgi:hypothetical protein